MDNPAGYILLLTQLMQLQQQQAATASIFDDPMLWIVAGIVGAVLIKFLVIAAAVRSLHRGLAGGDDYRPGPLGALGPLFGVPAVLPRPRDEIQADRQHSYRVWGTRLSAVCILGGIGLFLLGITGTSDVGIRSLVTIKNAAPGTILFVFGFLIWRSTHR